MSSRKTAHRIWRSAVAFALASGLVVTGAAAAQASEPDTSENLVPVAQSELIDAGDAVGAADTSDAPSSSASDDDPNLTENQETVSEEAPAESVVEPELGESAPEPASAATQTVEPEGNASTSPSDEVADPAPQPIVLSTNLTVTPKKSLTVAVKATGFSDDINGVSAAVIEKGDESKITADGGTVGRTEAAVAAGVAEFDLKSAASELYRTQSYEVVLWKQGAIPVADSDIYARSDLKISKAQWDQLLGVTKEDPAWNAKAKVGSFDWGIRTKFREYVVGPIAHGKITVSKPATGAGPYKFPQSKNSWNPETQTGTVHYAGRVNFKGHWDDFERRYVLDLDFANPIVKVKSAAAADLQVMYEGKALKIATIDLKAPGAKRVKSKDGSIRFEKTIVKLTKAGAEKYFQDYVGQDYELDPLTFTVGADSKTAKPVDPPKKDDTDKKPGKRPKKEQPKPLAPVSNGEGGQAAGSLSWGISSRFASYVTGSIAKGSISTSGVGRSGGAYLFPQAAGGSWNAKSQTGSVQYSGVVTFTGHKGLLSESFSNPVITVSSASSGTISSGGRSFRLDLGSASKSVGSNGEVTWSGVPVEGGITGGASGGSQYTLPVDPLSFTVGTASNVNYSSTAEGKTDKPKRDPAATPPATTGIRVLTEAKKITQGGRIELEAAGFEKSDEGVLVVIYSDPVVLDAEAKADENGVVRWSGTLPEDLSGRHTITLQGSANAGAVIDIQKTDDKNKKSAKQADRAKQSAAKQKQALADQVAENGAVVAGPLSPAGAGLWEWWVAAGGLVAIAACTSVLAIRQRRSS
ncbi:MAG: HtaA domain-containing protein [Leucobacter sp.]